MSLRGAIADFPLETIVQLIAATSKTGQLELRDAIGEGGVLGFDAGRLVAASSGDDVGEPALGAVFATTRGDFEFVPWNEPPAANLSGDLEQLLDRAVQERDRIVTDRKVVPDDRTRFKLSDRAATRGEITMSAEQWRTLLAVNGERDLRTIAEQIHTGRLAALALLAGLVRAGMLDTLEPAPVPPPLPEPAPAAAPSQGSQGSLRESQWTGWSPPAAPATTGWEAPAPPAAPSWETPVPSPAPTSETAQPPSSPAWQAPSWEAAPAAPAEPPAWQSPAAPTWEPPQAQTPSLSERMAALDSAPPAEAEQTAAADERLSALSGIFGAPAAPPAPEAPAAPPAPDARPAFSAEEMSTIIPAAPVEEKKKPGLFGRFRRKEPAAPAGAAVANLHRVAWSQGGQLAAFSNQLLVEYNSGQYGKGRVDERMTNLLMRVDEQADPIDRPLPLMDDRIDVQALERAAMPSDQIVPYLAQLVAQIHSDAEKAFGKDKAKKGYVAARQQVFGADASALTGPAVAGKLPKV